MNKGDYTVGFPLWLSLSKKIDLHVILIHMKIEMKQEIETSNFKID